MTARVIPTFHIEVMDCSWGFAGVLYSVWTRALRWLKFVFPKDEEAYA